MMTEHEELLLMLKRLQTVMSLMAQSTADALQTAVDLAQRPIEVMAPAVHLPAMPEYPPVVVEAPDFSAVVRELRAEVAIAAERTEQVLEVLIERFEKLAEKITSNRRAIVGGGGGRGLTDTQAVVLERVADATEAQLVPVAHDAIDMDYTGDNVTEVRYWTGGVGGTLVATLTLTYAGDNLTSVERS